MTDHPGSDPQDRPGPAGVPAAPPAGAPSDGLPEPDTSDTDASRSGTPESSRHAAPQGFDAAFEGEGWETRRRRRSSSGGDRSSSPRAVDSSRASSSGSARGRRRGNRRARHARSVVLHVVLGLLGLGLAWVVVTALLAAYQLNEARSDLTALRTQIASGGSAIGSTADSLADHAHHAAVLTRGPAWATLAAIPYVGEPFEAVRGITTQTSTLVDGAAPGLVAAAGDIDPRTVVTAGTVDLAALQRAAPSVRTASVTTDRVSGAVAALPDSTWLPFVDTATRDLAGQLDQLSGTLRTTDQALQVLPTMLGGDGRTRRYFVAFQNNAELRGTGGLPGAFAIVAATGGKVSIERFESDSLLGRVPSGGLDFGKAFDQHYKGDLAYVQYGNSNLSPHFPYAAQIWCSMWRNASGEQLDGALTIDPGALSYLLAATGPATAPDGQQVTTDNVVALLQKDAYAKFPEAGENDDRKEYILEIAKAVEQKILAGSRNSRALLQGLTRSVSERRIVAYSTDPAVQQVLAAAPIGGTVADTAEPYSLLVLNNGAGGKLDYYLGRSVTWARTGCGDTREVTVTIALTNNAPASGLPPYVGGRVGIARPADLVPGQNRTVVNYVATKGAQLLGATLDGQPGGAGLFDEEGHPSFQTIVELKPGQTRTWVLRLQEPAGNEPVSVVRQPGVLPVDVTVDDHTCGG